MTETPTRQQIIDSVKFLGNVAHAHGQVDLATVLYTLFGAACVSPEQVVKMIRLLSPFLDETIQTALKMISKTRDTPQ